MKALLTILFCANTMFVFGQWASAPLISSTDVEIEVPAPKETLYLQRYRGVFFGVGPRYLNTDPGVISTTYVDDSPSMDSFNAEFEVKDGYTQMALNFGYKGGRYRGTSHDYMFDVTLGTKNYTTKVGYSWGWNFLTKFKNSELVIRPAVQVVGVNTVFNLGTIQNNAAYIQVGETQYYERELKVELRGESVTFAPRLDFTYVFADRWDCFFKAAYDVPAANTNPAIKLSVPENLRSDDSPGPSSLDIDTANPLVTYQGEKLESLPYTTGGLRMTFGVSFLWNR